MADSETDPFNLRPEDINQVTTAAETLGIPAWVWHDLEGDALSELAQEALERGDFTASRRLTREAERADYQAIVALYGGEG